MWQRTPETGSMEQKWPSLNCQIQLQKIGMHSSNSSLVTNSTPTRIFSQLAARPASLSKNSIPQFRPDRDSRHLLRCSNSEHRIHIPLFQSQSSQSHHRTAQLWGRRHTFWCDHEVPKARQESRFRVKISEQKLRSWRTHHLKKNHKICRPKVAIGN